MKARSLGSVALAWTVLSLLGCFGGSGLSAGQPLTLSWQGASPNPVTTPPVAEGLKRHLIRLQPFIDSRKDATKVGEWDDKTEVKTSSNVASYLSEHFSDMMKTAGAKLVASGESVEIRGEILEFNVVEGGMFNGEARARFNIVVSGRATWEGTYAGKSKRWGRTHKAENYNEALTNAFQELTRQLLQDEGFGKALSAVAAPATPH